ncbi:hypothetical protein DV735_g4640, partial [Chaetothyriales sp. CBS 134920]
MTPSPNAASQLGPKTNPFQPQVCVVDFHHARGPEVEFWLTEEGNRLYGKNDWSLLPFMALSDGAHARVEEYSWFTLLDRARTGGAEGNRVADDSEGNQVADDHPAGGEEGTLATNTTKATAKPGDKTLFGIACTRQTRSDALKNKSADVTRSSVQKSVVVVVGDATGLAELKTRLGFVTETWFGQNDFADVEILKAFQDSLIKADDGEDKENINEPYFGLSLREVIHDFRHQTLVLVKALLLQRKILFFGSSCEQVCLLQFALLSLIPGLMAHLEDCAHPDLETPIETQPELGAPNASDRAELLSYMGQPLRIFGKGSVFMPYAPLQHLDLLADYDTKSYVVGSTNSLLLQQKEHYADLLVNLDDNSSISIQSSSLRQALQLSAADRRWIDALTEKVVETWDEKNPSQPRGMGFQGSEGSIRLAFEEYILSLCSSMAYQQFREAVAGEQKSFDAISRAVKARRSAEKEVMRAEFDESTLPKEEEEAEDEDEAKLPKTPPQRPSLTGARRERSSISSDSANALTLISSPPKKVDLVAQAYDPADNALDFSPHFLSAWQSTVNCQRLLLQVQGRRIFDVVEPRHPTAGGFNIDDLNRRLVQNLGDLRKQYNVDERYAMARGRAGEALQASRERWARWWSDLEERRRNKENDEPSPQANQSSSLMVELTGPVSVSASASASGTTNASGSAGWTTTLRERASKVQLQRPEPT